MDTRTGSFSGQRTYDDFVPSHHLLEEQTADTLLLELAGFRKEHIKVQIDSYGKLRISGERPVGGNKWLRFRKEYQVPETCNLSAIRAKYENGLVYITMPKIVTPQLPIVPDQTPTPTTTQLPEPNQQPNEEPFVNKEEKRTEPKVEEQKDTSKSEEEATKYESTQEEKETSEDEEEKEEEEEEEEEEDISSNGRFEMLKKKIGGLRERMYNSRKAIWAAYGVAVVSIVVGLIINYKLSENDTTMAIYNGV